MLSRNRIPPTLPFRDNETLIIISPWKSNTWHLEANLFLRLWHSFSRLGETKIHNFFVVGHLSSQLYLHKTLSNSKTILRFYYRKRFLWSFWKKLFMSSKMIFDQKNILVKKLEANWYSFVKKERTSKLIKFWWQ